MANYPAIDIVALYAGLNGFILLWLGAHVSNVRRQRKVFIGALVLGIAGIS